MSGARSILVFAIISILALAVSVSAQTPTTPADSGKQVQSELGAWLDSNGQSPTEYVLSKFKDHDVVILGENHLIKDDPLLVQQLIPSLAAHGIYILATEFANASSQPQIDSLLNGSEWNEELGRQIQMRQYSLWAFREYLDIFKAAWEYNHKLSPGQERFRILGMDYNPDWSVIETKEDLNDPTIKAKVWGGHVESEWAAVVLKEVHAGKKVLAYCGIRHGFTRYQQPRVNGTGDFDGWGAPRFGNYLQDSLGSRVFLIMMHHLWSSRSDGASIYPVYGVIDRLMLSREGGPRPVGFDVVGGPFGLLKDDSTYYSAGYTDFKLADFCDGYIYFRPVSQFQAVTFIEGFYNDSNIIDARKYVDDPLYRHATPQEFEAWIKNDLQTYFVDLWKNFK